jgi:hypothetical protein
VLRRPQRGQLEGRGVVDCPVRLFVVVKCNRFKAERDDNNNVNKLDAPPILPHEFIKVVL